MHSGRAASSSNMTVSSGCSRPVPAAASGLHAPPVTSGTRLERSGMVWATTGCPNCMHHPHSGVCCGVTPGGNIYKLASTCLDVSEHILTASSSDRAPSLKDKKHCEQFAEAAGKYLRATLSPSNCTLSPVGDFNICLVKLCAAHGPSRSRKQAAQAANAAS